MVWWTCVGIILGFLFPAVNLLGRQNKEYLSFYILYIISTAIFYSIVNLKYSANEQTHSTWIESLFPLERGLNMLSITFYMIFLRVFIPKVDPSLLTFKKLISLNIFMMILFCPIMTILDINSQVDISNIILLVTGLVSQIITVFIIIILLKSSFLITKLMGWGFLAIVIGNFIGMTLYVYDTSHAIISNPHQPVVIAVIIELAIFNYALSSYNSLERINLIEEKLDLKKSALAAQMNPHFIFNCLNSIQHFIMKNDKESAMDYLGTFASLIRGSLRSSAESSISVAAEIKMLDNYLALEQLRLDHSFEYVIEADKSFDTFQTYIPPMLIQPFVENAVIHGVKDKKDGGKITIDFFRASDHLHVSIQDNGSRQKSREPKHKSYGTSITQKRLAIINDLSESDINVAPEYTEMGTFIQLKIKVQSL